MCGKTTPIFIRCPDKSQPLSPQRVSYLNIFTVLWDKYGEIRNYHWRSCKARRQKIWSKCEAHKEPFISHMQDQEATLSLWRGRQRQAEISPRHLGALAHQKRRQASREVQVHPPTHWTHLCPAAAPSRAHRGESKTQCSLSFLSQGQILD